jgi:succinyl-diaminopimelate desuccinylase
MTSSATLDLSLELLRQPSVTPVDHTCQNIMAERLENIGFKIENMRFDDVDNLWARKGTESPVFCFAGQTDVVPTGNLDAWGSDPFQPEIRDGKIFARGADDDKGQSFMHAKALEYLLQHDLLQCNVKFLLAEDSPMKMC